MEIIRKSRKWLSKKNVLIFLFVLLIGFIYFINSLHESYPDEFDNIMGGWYLLHGELIYKDWFTHHGPVAYYIAGFLEIFSGQSFVRFRFFYAIFLLFLTFGGFYYIKKTFGFEKVKFYLFLIFLIAIGSTYFWGQMLLADSLSAFLLLPVFGLIVLKAYHREKLTNKDFIFVSALSSMSLLSSLTYTYLIGGIYLAMVLYYFFAFEKPTKFSVGYLKPFFILSAPFLIFLVYLLLTGSLMDFIEQGIFFNQKYYVYNYPRPEGSTFINPIRFAIVIAQDFHNNFSSLLIGLPTFNFTFPFNITLAVVNMSLIIYLIMKKKFVLALFVFLSLIYSNARSNPWTSKETDYQSAVYMLFSLFNICFFLTTLYEDLKKDIEYPKKVIYTFLFLISLLYSFFTFTYLLRTFSYKAYGKYMGTQSTIYDRPKIAPIINSIVTKNDYALIGPFEFEELFYMNAKLPTKYQILIPGMGKSPEIQEEMLREIEETKPKVIYFDKRFHILGSSPEMHGKFFLNYLDEKYITLLGYTTDEGQVYSKIPIDSKVDLETKLYIRKENVEEILDTLIKNNYIEIR